MKLGVCFMVFDGDELLKPAVESIRKVVDHVSVTYQTTSYFGNPADPGLFDRLNAIKSIDELIFYEPDLKIHHKENELRLRNIGLEASRKAGCSHHIAFDVDEFCKPDELENAKKLALGYDMTIAPLSVYYKDPTYLVWPEQNSRTTFIHPVDNQYDRMVKFPRDTETTRRLVKYEKCRVFTRDEIVVHHMSYVRKDIRKKFQNSDNAQFYQLKKFYENFDNYKLGGRVCLLPDYLNRKTIQVENFFNIDPSDFV